MKATCVKFSIDIKKNLRWVGRDQRTKIFLYKIIKEQKRPFRYEKEQFQLSKNLQNNFF